MRNVFQKKNNEKRAKEIEQLLFWVTKYLLAEIVFFITNSMIHHVTFFPYICKIFYLLTKQTCAKFLLFFIKKNFKHNQILNLYFNFYKLFALWRVWILLKWCVKRDKINKHEKQQLWYSTQKRQLHQKYLFKKLKPNETKRNREWTAIPYSSGIGNSSGRCTW